MAITTVNKNPNSAYTLDDFDEAKNYHRVLFKPGVAVQARELTQLQTAIQRQLDYHGQHTFTDGGRVVGGKASIEFNYDYIKVEDTFTTGGTAFVTSSYLGDYKDSIIQGVTSGVKARVLQSIGAAGTDANDSTRTGILDNPSGDAITLYIQYISSDGDRENGTGGTNKNFLAGEIIELLDSSGSSITTKKTRVGGFGNGDGAQVGVNEGVATASEFIGSTFVDDATSDSNITTAEAVGTGCQALIEEGAYFIKGTFVYVAPQQVILDKYTNTPSYFVGLQITESVVNSSTDSSLNDNAAGTTNLSAPGADRYNITTKLIKTPKDQTPNSEYTQYTLLLTVENGVISSDKASGDPYNTTELTSRLARRTHEESGNYSLAPFKYDVREYLNSEGGNNGYKTAAAIVSDGDAETITAADAYGRNTIAFGIEPNTIYVDGYRVQNLNTKYLKIDKPRTSTIAKGDVEREINYGNYFLITASTARGMPDINNFTIATLQTATPTAAVAHFIDTVGTGPTSNRTRQKVRYEQTAAHASADNFKKTAADGTVTLNLDFAVSNAGSAVGLIFDLEVSYDGSAVITILDGGTNYATNWDVTIPESELGTSGAGTIHLDGTVLGVGTCRIRSLEKHVPSTANTEVRLHVFDVNITRGSLTLVNTINQPHEQGTGADFTSFLGVIPTAHVGKLYSNTRTGITPTTQVFRLPYRSIKHLGSHVSPTPEVPRVILKKKYKFNKDSNSATSKTFALATGESLVGTTGFLTQDDGGLVLTTNVSESSGTVTVSGLNASEDDADCNIIITIAKTQTDPANNKSLRTKTVAYSQTNSAPFTYAFDGYSDIRLHKTDIAKLYYVYSDTTKKAGTVAANGGAAGSTTLTLTAAVAGITPGMRIVKTSSDTGNVAPVGYGIVSSVTAAGVNPTVITLNRPLTVAANNEAIILFDNLRGQFTVDDGQRDAYYDEGSLLAKSSGTAIANLRVKFKYYSHGAGDYFTIDSLSGDEKTYYSGQYKSLNLRDCIDFRPVKAVTNGSASPVLGKEFSSGAGAITGKPPAEGKKVTTDMEFYLPRVDKVVVTKEGTFEVIKGVPGLSPTVPEDRSNSMTLFTVALNGFMYRALPQKDFSVSTNSYPRYQMKDIAQLDSRVKKLEYYTSLNFLESAATNQHVVDADGSPMFKNGIFVDSFKGHNMGNVNHPDYLNSIDKYEGTLRPHCNFKNVPLRRFANDMKVSGTNAKSSKIVEKNSIYTLPYTNVPFIEQPYAVESIKVNPYNIFTWGGTMHLSPDTDEWIDTIHRPDVVIDNAGMSNSLLSILEEENALGTFYNEWQTIHTGIESTVVSDTQIQLEATHGWNVGAQNHEGVGGAWMANQTHNYDFQRVDINALLNDATGLQDWHDTGLDDTSGMRLLVDETISSEVTFHDQTREGFNNSVVWDTTRQSQGTRIVETNIIPFMRPRTVYFRAEQLKPNSRFYPFFDGIDVSDYCVSVAPDYGPDGFIEWTKQEAVRHNYYYNRRSASPNGPLITDAGGKLFGKFQIPNNAAGMRFKVGTKQFRLSDDSSNNTETELSYAESSYYAQGQAQYLEETIHSTRVPSVETTQLSNSRIVREDAVTKVQQQVRYIDPLAQTFICDQSGGMYTTKLDLFVANADKTGGDAEKASIPLRVGLRLVENGIPTQKIVPGSDVTVYYSSKTNGHNGNALVVGDTYTIKTVGNATWANVGWLANETGPNGDKHGVAPGVGDSFVANATNGGGTTGIARAENTCYASDITNDASVACPIVFEHPVYLSEATEYAVVLIASSELWKVFFSETGRLDITGNASEPALITKQPYNGVFFTSQNASTWTEHQLRDLKFNLYRASFDVNNADAVNYKVNFVNDRVEADILRSNPFSYISKPSGTTTVIRVHHSNHGMYTGNQKGAAAGGSPSKNSVVVLSGCVNENGLTAANLNAAAGHTVHSIEHDSYCITVTGQATTLNIRGGGNTVAAEGNAQFNSLYVYNENFQPAGTNLSAKYDTTAGRSMDGNRAARFGQTLDYAPVATEVITLNKSTPTQFPCLVASEKNETSKSGLTQSSFLNKTFGLSVLFSNDSNFLSPVIDGRRNSLFLTQNRISDPGTYNEFGPDGTTNSYYESVEDITAAPGSLSTSSSSTQAAFYGNMAGAGRFYIPDTSPIGVDSINNYITKNVQLENSASELRVLANVKQPKDSSVHLYYKTSSSLDSNFNLLPWTYANPQNVIAEDAGYDNVEWLIGNPSAPANPLPDAGFAVFSMKIVLSGKDSSDVPMVRNFRAIAVT